MHAVCCYLCGSGRGEVLFEQPGGDPYWDLIFDQPPSAPLNWLVCRDCGFAYRSPVLDEDELKILYARYEEDVFKGIDPNTYFDRIVHLPRDVSENWAKADWVATVMEGLGLGESPSVLDIGCGGGTLLHTLNERVSLGDVCGVELNPAYAELALRRLGADIRNELYTSGAFGRVFNLIICTKVLEHVPNPLPFLQQMASDLSEDGLLFIEVPDVSDLYTLPPSNERFFIPHIYFFSTNTLSTLLAKAGFYVREIRVISTHRGRAYLQVLAAKGQGGRPICKPPFDDPQWLAKNVAKNLERYVKGEVICG